MKKLEKKKIIRKILSEVWQDKITPGEALEEIRSRFRIQSGAEYFIRIQLDGVLTKEIDPDDAKEVIEWYVTEKREKPREKHLA